MDLCYHTLFDSNDSNYIFNELINNNSKNGKEPKNLSSTSICSRGMDISFKTAILINPTPHMIEQIIGRINRWDFLDKSGTLYIVVDDTPSEVAIYKNNNEKNYGKQMFVWNCYKQYIKYLENRITNNKISLFDLKELRMKFFEENEDEKISYKNLIKNNLQYRLRSLLDIKFSKGSYINKKNDNSSMFVTDAIDARGDNKSRFFTKNQY
jgi:hypothetical protein